MLVSTRLSACRMDTYPSSEMAAAALELDGTEMGASLQVVGESGTRAVSGSVLIGIVVAICG